MSRPRASWSEPELQQLDARYADTPTAALAAALGKSREQVYSQAARRGLKKSAAYLARPDSGRLQRGSHIGLAGQFQKGHVPANKGLKGVTYPGCVATQFQPGQRRGKALENYQPIGSERLSKDGYLQRKVNDDLPLQGRWRGVHLLNWEALHGPLPAGHALVFKDGDKRNTAPENLELVTRAELMRRNSYHTNYPKEVAQLIQLRGALQRKINRAQRESEESPA